MEAVDLQAKKMGAQDPVSSTEESLGVSKVVSTSDSKPPKQQKGIKRLGRCYRCGQERHFSKDKSCPARQSVCTKCKKQMELSTNSQQYLSESTHKGLYAQQPLTYGIASTPALFQSNMGQILQGMDNVRCRIDDIIIRTDPHEHLQVLDEVLTRLE